MKHLTLTRLNVTLAMSATFLAMVFLATPVSTNLHGLVQMVETAGALERVALWQREILGLLRLDSTTSFPTLNTSVLAYAARLAYAGMFAAQILAVLFALHQPIHSFRKWLIGPIIAHVAMLLMPPSNADVFFYAITGDMARQGTNPYIHRLSEFPDNPFLPFNHWVDMSAVYGPLWVSISRGLVSVTGDNPALAALAFKVVLGITALALALLTRWFVAEITSNMRLATAAGVMVAWQPNLIVESTGLAHNDPVMMLLSAAGIMLAVVGGLRAVRGGLVLVTLSALIKYTSAPLLGLLGLARLGERRADRTTRRIAVAWVLDGLTIGAVLVACFLPFWAGIATFREMLSEPGRLFSSPLYLYPKVLLEHLGPNWIANRFETITSTLIQIAAILITLGTILWFGRKAWLSADAETGSSGESLPGWTSSILLSWAVIMSTLALLPVNSHPWYWTWPVVPVAIHAMYSHSQTDPVGDLPVAMPRWFWGYMILTGIMTIAYHTRIVHP